uniref:Laccase 31 n=1 Tax=Salvia miltiorrhiza TaxID=226208 RepID=A0A4Y5RRE6_SALMI|nr:laccase 31 [Salvia miltiorrhiza]
MKRGGSIFRWAIRLLFICLVCISTPAEAALKKYHFNVQVKNVSRLCHAKPIVTVNGMYPGPTIYVREGDRVQINVTNHAQYNMSIHWHGLKQYRNGWADGPAYVTQCPVQTGQSYTYDFNVTGQRGTLWWHAHILWLRATVHGAIVIMPKEGTSYPFPQPYQEHNLILGEWWNDDVEEVVKQGNKLGLPPKMSDAHTINGKPGPLFPCAEKCKTLCVVHAKTDEILCSKIIFSFLFVFEFFIYFNMFKLIFCVGPRSCRYLRNGGRARENLPSQDHQRGTQRRALLRGRRPQHDGCGDRRGLHEALLDGRNPDRPGADHQCPRTDKPGPRAVLHGGPAVHGRPDRRGQPNRHRHTTVQRRSEHHNPRTPPPPPPKRHRFRPNLRRQAEEPQLPAVPGQRAPRSRPPPLLHDRARRRPLPGLSKRDEARRVVEQHNLRDASGGAAAGSLLGVEGRVHDRLPRPAPDAVQLHGGAAHGQPPHRGGGQAAAAEQSGVQHEVELVLQDTNLLSVESHPFHLHGYNFFVVGTGVGNFDPARDPARFNLVDPPERNTVGVPTGGWTAIRFRADNPGVWFMHCHLEVHTGWGLKTAFVVEDGPDEDHAVLPPPKDLPPC